MSCIIYNGSGSDGSPSLTPSTFTLPTDEEVKKRHILQKKHTSGYISAKYQSCLFSIDGRYYCHLNDIFIREVAPALEVSSLNIYINTFNINFTILIHIMNHDPQLGDGEVVLALEGATLCNSDLHTLTGRSFVILAILVLGPWSLVIFANFIFTLRFSKSGKLRILVLNLIILDEH